MCHGLTVFVLLLAAILPLSSAGAETSHSPGSQHASIVGAIDVLPGKPRQTPAAMLLTQANLSKTQTDIRVGVSLGLTGQYAKPALMQERGFRLWQKLANRQNGILGRQVEITVEDDQSNPGRAHQIYTDWAESGDVDLFFGPYSSQISMSVAPIFEDYGFPTLLPGAASDRIFAQGYQHIFGLFTQASKYFLELIKLAVEHDLKRVAIAHASDIFASEVGRGARSWAITAELDVVLFEEFAKGTRDLRSVAINAREANAELLLVAGHLNEAIDMRRALAKIEWYPRAYAATIGPTLTAFHVALGPDSELVFAPSLWEPDENLRFRGSQEFISEFRQAYGELPSYHAANAFAAGQVLEAAILQANSFDRGAIRQALQELDTQTIIGRYRVDAYGIPINHRPVIVQWLGGKKTIVYPPEHRGQSHPVFAPER